MNRSTWKLGLAALGLAGAMAGGGTPFAAAGGSAKAADKSAAAEPNTLTDQEKAGGWRLLFDGKTAGEWRNYGRQRLSDKWQVKDGALVLAGKGGGDIVTRDEFDSYELVLDYNISRGGNSGLMFHVQEVKGKPPYDSGPEVQIQDNANGHDPQLSGWLYQLYQPPTDEKTGKPLDATKPVGEWNELRLVLDGPKGTVSMNGVKYYDFEMWTEDWGRRVAKSKFGKWENFAKAKKGHICLQDHGDEVAFRNIKIRPITAK